MAKTAFRNSLKPRALALAIPSKKMFELTVALKIAFLGYLQPSSMLVVTVATVSGAESIVNIDPDCTFK